MGVCYSTKLAQQVEELQEENAKIQIILNDIIPKQCHRDGVKTRLVELKAVQDMYIPIIEEMYELHQILHMLVSIQSNGNANDSFMPYKFENTCPKLRKYLDKYGRHEPRITYNHKGVPLKHFE